MFRAQLTVLAMIAQLAVALPALADKRLAMVVGNANYQNAKSLQNPENDANDVAAALRRLDFEVVLGIDLSKSEFDRSIRAFGNEIDEADVVLFYFAGHGIQRSGENYLLPTDIELARPDGLPFEAVKLADIISQLESEDRTRMLFLDASRENPFARRFSSDRGANLQSGLSEPRNSGGMLVVFATAPGQLASEGDGRNSPFAGALLKYIETPGIDAKRMLDSVGREVWRQTDRQQRPWTQNSALFSDFYFQSGAEKRLPPVTVDEIYWETIKDSENRDLVQEFIRSFPQSSRWVEALARDRELQNSPPSSEPIVASSPPPATSPPANAATAVTSQAPQSSSATEQEPPVITDGDPAEVAGLDQKSTSTDATSSPSGGVVRSSTEPEPKLNSTDPDRNKVTQPDAQTVATLVEIIPRQPARGYKIIALAEPQTRSVIVDVVNIRQGPGASYSIIGRALGGQVIDVVGHSVSGTWLELRLGDGGTGFIYAPLVSGSPTAKLADQSREPGVRFRDCENCPELVAVDLSGSELDGSAALAVAAYEVTFAEWDACVADGGCGGYTPDDNGWGRDERPVIYVSFQDANGFTDWLSKKTGKSYRLPSGEEWEFLARVGDQSDTPWGAEPSQACGFANVHDESSVKGNRFNWNSHPCDDRFATTATVGSFRANDHGLHDMIGNVAEWTSDCDKGDCTRRVVRGGSWYDPPRWIGFSAAVPSAVTSRVSSDGFRIVRSLSEGLKPKTSERPVVVIAN